MDTQLLCEKFERMGARVKVAPDAGVERVRIDIGHDRKGEFFDLKVRQDQRVVVNAVDVRPKDRHLLLMVRDEDRNGLPSGSAQRFLCGHDERAWFVAAVPENRRRATDVRTAMEALKPWEALWSQDRNRVRFKDRNRRKNRGFIRQGEWFFLPAAWVNIPSAYVLRNEPLVRTGGKPHMAEFAYRDGGELVYVDARNRAITAPQYQRLLQRDPALARGYAARRRNMRVLVKGRISHADHKTIVLRDWHSVVMNTENQSEAMRYVAFID
jgi:hypothetical protein